jgi:hypothetical protein
MIRIKLDVCVRAENCNVQLKRLNDMRDAKIFSENMFNSIRKLDQQLVQDGGFDWTEHTSLHATNAARNEAGNVHLERVAAAKRGLIFRWRVACDIRNACSAKKSVSGLGRSR